MEKQKEFPRFTYTTKAKGEKEKEKKSKSFCPSKPFKLSN